MLAMGCAGNPLLAGEQRSCSTCRSRSALPGILTGMRICMAASTVPASSRLELIAATSGLGFLIMRRPTAYKE